MSFRNWISIIENIKNNAKSSCIISKRNRFSLCLTNKIERNICSIYIYILVNVRIIVITFSFSFAGSRNRLCGFCLTCICFFSWLIEIILLNLFVNSTVKLTYHITIIIIFINIRIRHSNINYFYWCWFFNFFIFTLHSFRYRCRFNKHALFAA